MLKINIEISNRFEMKTSNLRSHCLKLNRLYIMKLCLKILYEHSNYLRHCRNRYNKIEIFEIYLSF